MKIDTYFTRELIRPWKAGALLAGIGMLYLGVNTQPDWTPATIWGMSLPTYVCAPWAVDVFMRARWRLMPLALLAAWGCCDLAWMLSIDGSEAAWSLRAIQFPASLCMFVALGLVLRPKTGLREVLTFKRGAA